MPTRADTEPFVVERGGYRYLFTPEASGFQVTCTDVPGLRVRGNSFEDALGNAVAAVVQDGENIAEIVERKEMTTEPNNGEKWTWRKKVLVGIVAAYFCAVTMQILFNVLINAVFVARDFADLLGVLRPSFWGWYSGYGALLMSLTQDIGWLVFLSPMLLFIKYPTVYAWCFAAVSLTFWMAAPATELYM